VRNQNFFLGVFVNSRCAVLASAERADPLLWCSNYRYGGLLLAAKESSFNPLPGKRRPTPPGDHHGPEKFGENAQNDAFWPFKQTLGPQTTTSLVREQADRSQVKNLVRPSTTPTDVLKPKTESTHTGHNV
jgi:hypothetical protein